MEPTTIVISGVSRNLETGGGGVIRPTGAAGYGYAALCLRLQRRKKSESVGFPLLMFSWDSNGGGRTPATPLAGYATGHESYVMYSTCRLKPQNFLLCGKTLLLHLYLKKEILNMLPLLDQFLLFIKEESF